MPLAAFHPAVARWFETRLGEPTPAQVQGWEAIRSGRHTLIAAPTGSGKTLAAFLHALDQLLREGLDHQLPDEVRVVYVSPLKALSADIHKNLAEPRREIRQIAEELGLPPVKITAAVRTGDTPAAERTAMLKRPPHLLVTTPESLYLLLTAERSREMLRTARAVIVDEVHAVIESRRGSHLALSLERLDHVAGRPLQRIGLSATQKPIEAVARFLVGTGNVGADGTADCAVVDEGHRRTLDLAIEVPESPLEAVMSNETWEEVYDRIAALAREHRTTLLFVNTRRLAERAARYLSERLGEDQVAAHHGSLSREVRHDAESRLKEGKLRLLVATASLELGIDIGAVDLVCQLGSTRRIAALLQRVGRSGHTVRGTPKGRLFPLSRDDLAECVALLRSVRAGELDHLIMPEHPLDVVAQQLTAEASAEDWSTDGLYSLTRRAWPYRELTRETFDRVVDMAAHGFTTRRGRRGALLHLDQVNGRVRGRRGARLAAITSGGAIPDLADYRVILEPEETFVGTVNEDFAVESAAGDIFQLGNTSWEIVKIESGTVRVHDAHGQPPTIPFWLGEAPARSDELSAAVSALRRDLGERLNDPDRAAAWLTEDPGVPRAAADQLVAYLTEARRMLGALPTADTLILERFFDESGGMQLILHSPLGSRINRAWGLALRKRFCRQFNFELQAAATSDALLLSLGPQHSFPLADVFRYLHPDTVREILIQALLDAPMFATRWRWNATISLAILRSRGGKKTPAPLQRMEADDLLAAAFPDAAACLENIAGDREIPDHPLVTQAITDCLEEAMDLPGLTRTLAAIHAGEITLLARDLPEPSPLAAEILNARPYAFLDDAPLEERRTQAVYSRRAFEPGAAGDLGALDPEAIERVRREAWPDPRDADELHDALLVAGCLTDDEMDEWPALRDALAAAGRAVRVGGGRRWFATERRGDDLTELVRGRLEVGGPVTADQVAAVLGVGSGEIELALHVLEGQGAVLRGHFSPGVEMLEWCDRRLLARIHRYTISRLRAEIEPVGAADFQRFLFDWQRLTPEHRVAGLEGLASVAAQLDGFELAAGAWEADVLAARADEYDPSLLDALCLMGRVMWGRLSPPMAGAGSTGPLRTTPIALFQREHRDAWLSIAAAAPQAPEGAGAQAVLEALTRRGASFFSDLVVGSGLLPTQVEQALAELAGLGLVTADGFTGLRALITPSDRRKPLPGAMRRRHRVAQFGIESAGRWTLLRGDAGGLASVQPGAEAVETAARALLRRWGVMSRRVLDRESNAPRWRDLVRCYWRLEARGEIRGGRFVAGLSGEQFALPDAVAALRAVRRRDGGAAHEVVSISAADPLNLTGILTPGERVPALMANRIVYRDGVPVAAREAGRTAWLVDDDDPARRLELERVLVRRRTTPALRAYLGMAG